MTRDTAHHLFFSRDIGEKNLRLSAEETRHAVRALRLSAGDEVQVSDGLGRRYRCTVTATGPGELQADILQTLLCAPSAPRLTLAVGIPGREHFELLLEQAVPLGVAEIVPLECEYCQAPWWRGRWEKHAARFERKMISALKQSQNTFLPDVSAPRPFAAALADARGTLLTADAHGAPLPDSARHAAACTAFIGPPGGFSPSESVALDAKGACRVCLSANRLRTELAAVCLSAQLLRN